MDAELYKQIRQAVSEGMSSSWWVSLVAIIATAVISCLSGYLFAYGKKKGENLATKEDFDNLLTELQRTTQAAKEIETRISQGAWVGQSELEYRKQQLAEFYGPIYVYLKLSGELYRIWMDKKLQSINQGILETFRQQNEDIKKILVNKAHLIDGGHIPEAFTRFRTSSTIWNLSTARPGQPWVDQDVASLEVSKWPKEFETYIFSKTEELKHKLDELYKKHGIT